MNRSGWLRLNKIAWLRLTGINSRQGHQLVMGNFNQTANLWGNCPLCRNNYRNVPRNSHCTRCTRPGICDRCNTGRNIPAGRRTCNRCGRARALQGRGSEWQPSPSPPRTDIPLGLLNAEAASSRHHFKNSNTWPSRRGLTRVEYTGHDIVVFFHNSFHDRWWSGLANVASIFVPVGGIARAAGAVTTSAAARAINRASATAGAATLPLSQVPGIQVVTRHSSFRLRVNFRYVNVIDGRRTYTMGRRTELITGRNAGAGFLNSPFITVGQTNNSRAHERAANRNMENSIAPPIARGQAQRITHAHRADSFAWSPGRSALGRVIGR